jgi:hypothetical protein
MSYSDPFRNTDPLWEPFAGPKDSGEDFSMPDVAMTGALRRFVETDEAAQQIANQKQPTSVGWEQTPTGWKLIVVRDGVTREYLGPTDELLKLAKAAS